MPSVSCPNFHDSYVDRLELHQLPKSCPVTFKCRLLNIRSGDLRPGPQTSKEFFLSRSHEIPVPGNPDIRWLPRIRGLTFAKRKCFGLVDVAGVHCVIN